jgi:hypothetical protein
MDSSVFYKVLLIILSLAAAAATSVGLLKWKDDNPVEELVERYVEHETGVDIDITPNSPE